MVKEPNTTRFHLRLSPVALASRKGCDELQGVIECCNHEGKDSSSWTRSKSRAPISTGRHNTKSAPINTCIECFLVDSLRIYQGALKYFRVPQVGQEFVGTHFPVPGTV